MGIATRWLDRRLYPRTGANWDDELLRARISDRLQPDWTILDVGAGAGIVDLLDFRGSVARVCGIDPDPRVADNPLLDEGRQGFAESIPYEAETFDLAFADNVLEHLTDPTAVFTEVGRVLKPGGWFVVKTPNRRHYMPVIAASTPLWFHRGYNQLRGRASEDTFPTAYLTNTPEDLEHHADAAGLTVETVELVEDRPEYLRLSVPTYLAGAAWERAVNASERLARFRILMLAELRKPSGESISG